MVLTVEWFAVCPLVYRGGLVVVVVVVVVVVAAASAGGRVGRVGRLGALGEGALLALLERSHSPL